MGLMALSRLDLEVVLRDGELLMASGGEVGRQGEESGH